MHATIFRDVHAPALLTSPRAVFVLAIAAFLTLALLFRDFVIDDSYITYRYADNLAAGGGISYNSGDTEPVDGYTSFLWVAVSALAIRLGIDPLSASRFLSLLAGVASLWLLYRLGLALLGQWLLAAIPALLLGVSAEFALWTMSGMETTAFLFLQLFSISIAIWEVRSARRPVLSALASGITALMRPEGAALFVTLVVFLLLGNGSRRWRLRLQDAVLATLIFGFLFGGHFLWHAAYYGHPLPNSYYAKRLAHGGAEYVARFVQSMGPVAALALLSVVNRIRSRDHRTEPNWQMWFLMIIAFNFATVWNVNPLMAWDWRLFIPLYPILFLLAMDAVAALSLFARGERIPLAAVVAALLVAWVIHADLLPERIEHARRSASGIRMAHVSLGRWLRENVPRDTVLAVVDSGAIPYFSGLAAIDIANVPLNNTRYWHRGVPYDETQDGRPDVLVLAGSPRGDFGVPTEAFPFLRGVFDGRYTRVFRLRVTPDYELFVFMTQELANAARRQLLGPNVRQELPALVG